MRLDLTKTIELIFVMEGISVLNEGRDPAQRAAKAIFDSVRHEPESSDRKIQEDIAWTLEGEVVHKVHGHFDDIAADLITFIADRLKVYLRDEGIRHDLIDAVFALGEGDFVAIVDRVKVLQDFLGTEDGENLLAGYKRAANILKAESKKGDLPTGEAIRPQDSYGAALFDAMAEASPKISSALQSENYAEAMKVLANLRAPIDEFFTHTQIITDDTAVRDNNLRLLAMMGKTTRQIADFERIQS